MPFHLLGLSVLFSHVVFDVWGLRQLRRNRLRRNRLWRMGWGDGEAPGLGPGGTIRRAGPGAGCGVTGIGRQTHSRSQEDGTTIAPDSENV